MPIATQLKPKNKISPDIFAPCYAGAIANLKLFAALTEFVSRFAASPDDMELRIRIKHFCQASGLAEPNFPPPRPAWQEASAQLPYFIPLHLAIENPDFVDWLASQQMAWHTHNNIQEYHVNCNCSKPKCLAGHICSCLAIDPAVVIPILDGTITYRGRFFVHNPRHGKCLETKIACGPGGCLQLVQNLGDNSFVYQNFPQVIMQSQN
jgi:hypothetical protein